MDPRPHEETWELNGDINGGIEAREGSDLVPIARFMSPITSCREDWAEHNDARAQLAACAPEMARTLVNLIARLRAQSAEGSSDWLACEAAEKILKKAGVR